MSFVAYKNAYTDQTHYVFLGDEDRLPLIRGNDWRLEYYALPPDPCVVTATKVLETETPYLDSMKTIYELDRQLNIDAEYERETENMQIARINS